MNEEKFEQLLRKIYSQDIIPSEKLIQKTKQKLSKNRLVEYMVALVVSFNLAIFLAFIGFTLAAPYSLVYKVMLYMTVSCIYNSLALVAYLNKDHVNAFFQKFQGGSL